MVLFRGLSLVKRELGDSAEAWWQFPNKDKYGHEAISLSEKKREANLAHKRVSLRRFWQLAVFSGQVQWAGSWLLPKRANSPGKQQQRP